MDYCRFVGGSLKRFLPNGLKKRAVELKKISIWPRWIRRIFGKSKEVDWSLNISNQVEHHPTKTFQVIPAF